MSVPQFVDVSSYQGSINFTDYAAWARQWDGIARIAMKSTEGTGFTDRAFIANRTATLQVGIDSICYYHFARPDLNNTPQDEADYQHSVVGTIRPTDIIVLDIEVASPLATSEWVYQWLARQQANYGGKLPGIYASTAYIQERLQDARLEPFWLWEANWQFTPDERPPVPAPWKVRTFLQYTDNATNVPGIPGVVDCNIYLGGSIPTPQEEPTVIDLTNPTVASHFTGGPDIWQCTDNKFLVGHGILGFYQKFGGDALCGLTYLGLPLSNETAVLNKAGTTIGVVYQRFERGVLCYDPTHAIDNPPGSADVYLMHIDEGLGQDPRISQLQTEITNLQALLKASNLGQVASLGQQIADDVALIMKLVSTQ